MTTKIKMTINKSSSGDISKIFSDIIIQDCNVQISQDQYQSIRAVSDSLSRMFVSWNFLAMRPIERVSENKRVWWKYAYQACLEQRVRPYTWTRIRTVRQNYRNYVEIYKKILLNPNDTELKLDLQQYEDKLSVVNVVIARQQTRLLVHCASLSEKSFWDILPSPERSVLCDKIGFAENTEKGPLQHIGADKIANLIDQSTIFSFFRTQLQFSSGQYRDFLGEFRSRNFCFNRDPADFVRAAKFPRGHLQSFAENRSVNNRGRQRGRPFDSDHFIGARPQ